MSKHDALPHGAKTVLTEELQLAAYLRDQTVADAGVMLIWGLWGCGKTFTLDHLEATSSVEVIRITQADKAVGHELARVLYEKLKGHPSTLKGMALLVEIEKEIGVRPMLILVDESYLLNRVALRHLRWLHDQARANWGLVLAGITLGELEAMVPEFAWRVQRPHEVGPMSGTRLWNFLREFHELFANTDDRILRALNDGYGHGVPRKWTNILRIAHVAASQDGVDRITPDIAASVLFEATGKRPAAA